MIVALVIGLILTFTAVMPLVSSYSDDKTFTNEGYFYMQKISADDTDTYELVYEYDSDTQKLTYTYNDEAIDTSGWPVSPLNVTIATDGESWLLRASGTNEYVGMQGVGAGFAFGGHNTWAIEITFIEGTATAVATNSSNVSSTYTATYTDLWIYSPDPTDYIMKKADKPAYMLEDSEYLAMGVTSMTAWNTGIAITGTVSDFTPTIFYPPNLTTTVTNKNVVDTEIDGYIDLYSLDKLTFTINDGTTTVDATYSYFIVPASVTAATDNPDVYKNLVSVLPLFALILLVAGAASLVYFKNKD